MAVHGRYTIVGKLADGGMAEIFLGTQHGAEGFEKPVVLKRIHTAFSADPQFRNMFLDEAHISMSLNHGNIVQVLDLGVSGGRYFLVLDLVDGWDLHQVLKRARAVQMVWPPALALYVAGEICRALAFAHGKTNNGRPLGIVHRDVSPNNVLLSEQGEVKLADFGIAKAQRKREQTAAGVIKGKVAFMSPEQATGSPIDRRSDLFSVGTMLYLMTTDKQPFEGANDLETLSRVQRADFVAPDVVKPGLAPALVRVIGRAMRLPPDERYQTADEMLADLERVLRGEYQSAGQTELKQWLAQLERRDGAPTISKRLGMPLPSAPANGGTDLNAGTSFELRDLDLVGATEMATPTPPPARSPTPPPPPTPSPRPVSARGLPAQKEATPAMTTVDAPPSNTAVRKDRPRHFRGFWLGAVMALGAVIGLRYFAEWATEQGWFQPTPMNRGPATSETAPAAPAAKANAPAAKANAPTSAPAAAVAADAGHAIATAERSPTPAARAATTADASTAVTADAASAIAGKNEEEENDEDTDEETLLRKADPNAASAVIGEEEAAPPPATRKPNSKATAVSVGSPKSAPAAEKKASAKAPPPSAPPGTARLPGSGKSATQVAAPAPSKPAAPPYVTISLHITSEPVGAVVRIKRRVLGRTPINLRFKTDNSYELTFLKNGYTPATKLVTVRGTRDGKLAVSLKKKPAGATGLRSLFHPHR